MEMLTSLLLFLSVGSYDLTDRAIYYQLDKESPLKQLLFSHVYPESPYSKQAIDLGSNLLKTSFSTVPLSVEACISFFRGNREGLSQFFTPEEIQQINRMALHLGNRSKKGYFLNNIEEGKDLSDEEIDTSRWVHLHLLGEGEALKHYEAMIDLIALEIEAHLPKERNAQRVIDAINKTLFFDLGYRFPRQKDLSKESYSQLFKVIDQHVGVCLGLTILYLSIAERLGLPLSLYTPPGHIFLRHESSGVQIETTVRGVDFSWVSYQKFYLKPLVKRNKKELAGMIFFNEAAVCWHQGKHQEAYELYEQAQAQMTGDLLPLQFKAFQLFFLQRKEEGYELLKKIKRDLDKQGDRNPLIEDLLNGNLDIKEIDLFYNPVESIKEKEKQIRSIFEKYPSSETLLLELAALAFELRRVEEAFSLFQRYHEINSKDPQVEYQLAILCLERGMPIKGMAHLKTLKELPIDLSSKEIQMLELLYRKELPFFFVEKSHF